MEIEPHPRLDQLPGYLQDLASYFTTETSDTSNKSTVKVPDQLHTSLLEPAALQAKLLLKRHLLTEQLVEHGLHPPTIFERAIVYFGLGYPDLAAADSFVAYTLCNAARLDEWVTDLEPVELDGSSWPRDGYGPEIHELLCCSLIVLCGALTELGATEDAKEKFNELTERYHGPDHTHGNDPQYSEQTKVSQRKFIQERTTEMEIYVKHLKGKVALEGKADSDTVEDSTDPTDFVTSWDPTDLASAKFGWSRREIYPWNDYEPDRNSAKSVSEINSMLTRIAPDLVAKVTTLPALNEDGSSNGGVWKQLGLFAAKDLPPGTQVLKEKSLLTAIRPLDDALCDACGIDLESVDRESMRQCPGQDCDTTFCSQDCAVRATAEYHNPNLAPEDTDVDVNNDEDEDEDNDSQYPPSTAPFCGNIALHEIGRTASTTTAEWDLYFLLLTRTIQIATTQKQPPLSLPSIKYLWGDFNPVPTNKPTLPWSLHHNLTLSLQYFETLMHSVPSMKPYSATWLRNSDWWIQTTLLAKFRGVANAKQSTFDGKAEIAAVHPMWCLANHSCEPNVAWEPAGERIFTVREGGTGGEGRGIKEGEEIWSHYTDVRLSVGERRERLMEVLGGVCRCVRCLSEAGDGK